MTEAEIRVPVQKIGEVSIPKDIGSAVMTKARAEQLIKAGELETASDALVGQIAQAMGVTHAS